MYISMHGASGAHRETLLTCLLSLFINRTARRARTAARDTITATGQARLRFTDYIFYSVLGVPVTFTKTTERHLSIQVITMVIHKTHKYYGVFRQHVQPRQRSDFRTHVVN